MQQLLLYCRSGFENECAAEISERAAALDITGYVKAKPGTAYIVFVPYQPNAANALIRQLPWRSLIFARQVLLSSGLIRNLPITNRIDPLLAKITELTSVFGDVWLETPDTDDAKSATVFCRKFAPPLRSALQKAGLLTDEPGLPRLHLLFLNSSTVYLGIAWPKQASPWLMGIPRLKASTAAPSRSALKLEEALLFFLSPQERARRLQPGMEAVDLGAAPGGWTWQLTRRQLRVIAVDNGPLAEELLAEGLVEHRREDGFRYRPPHPVDWLVCDMVESPARVARLMGDWIARGDCRDCIFNLKLPMKKRYAEIQRCIASIAETAGARSYHLRFKQLYHDREEITGYLRAGILSP